MDLKNEDKLKKIGGIVIKIAVLVVVVALLAGLFRLYNSKRSETEESGNVMQGSVKLTEIDLNSMLAGTVQTVNVAEGDEVKAGDVILTLDADIVQAKVAQASANVGQAQAGVGQAQAKVEQAKAAKAQAEATRDAAQAQLNMANNGARAEDIAKAKASFEYAQKTYERMQTLYTEGAIAASDFDGVEAQYLAAKATYEEALNGARQEDKDAAAAQVQQASAAVNQYDAAIKEAEAAVKQYQATIDQAQAGVQEADAYLNQSVITAPSDGIITAVNVESGELISTGMALATLRTTEDAWIEVNVRETSLSKVSSGQTVDLTFPAYDGKSFKGTVSNIAKNPDFATKKATNENGSFDVLSYCVKIKMNDVDEDMYAGMTVMVDFGDDSSADSSSDAKTVSSDKTETSTTVSAVDTTTSAAAESEGDDQ